MKKIYNSPEIAIITTEQEHMIATSLVKNPGKDTNEQYIKEDKGWANESFPWDNNKNK